MSDLDFLDEELCKPSVFIDESKLSSEYVPDNLLFRQENLKSIALHFRSIFNSSNITRRMIITGPVGSGKTSITKKIGKWIQSKNTEGEEEKLKYIHVNCRRNRTQFMILLTIARKLNSHVPPRGYSADELMEIIVEILEVKEIVLFLVFDEIDYLSVTDSNNLLYSFSRTSDEENHAKHKIALIMISQQQSFFDNLDQSTKSSLAPAFMKIAPYTKFQLVKIIEDRMKTTFVQGSVSSESIYLAAEIASIKGDARRALELMWYGGKYADKDSSNIVYPDHIRLAKADIEPSLLKQTIEILSEHKLILLLGIARQLRYSHAAYITTGNAEEAYKIVCEEYKITARKHTQVWEYMKEFENIGIIVTRKSSIGQRGNTKYISIQDVSAIELEKEVTKQLAIVDQKTVVAF